MNTDTKRLPAPQRLVPSFLIMALGLALSACAAPPRDALNDYAWERLERLPKDAAEVAAAVAASSREAFLEFTPVGAISQRGHSCHHGSDTGRIQTLHALMDA